MNDNQTKARSIGFILLGILGLILLYAFGQPLLIAGIFNVGNAVGIVIALILIFIGFASKTFLRFWAALGQSSIGRIFKTLLCVVLIVGLILLVVITAQMIAACHRPPEPDSHATAIVLGCEIRGDKPSPMMARRLTVAKTYLEEHPEAKAVLTGGLGEGESYTEAEVMERWLIAEGIDEARLILENKSASTEENIRFAKELMQEEELGPEVVIVTSDFHLYRGMYIAQHLGLEPSGLASKTSTWLLPTFYMRELAAVVYQWFRML